MDETDELRQALEGAEPRAIQLALKSLLTTEPMRMFDRLSSYLSVAAIGEPGGAEVAVRILRFFAAAGDSPSTQWTQLLSTLVHADRRWMKRALEVRRHPLVGGEARYFLRLFTREEIDTAVRRWPDPEPTPRVAYRGPRDFVARYRAGDHTGVWRDVRSAGLVDEPDLREEIMALALVTMERVRSNVERVTERLRAAGWVFEEGPGWTPSSHDVDPLLRRVEELTGARCPIVLEAFWKVVGRVDWRRAFEFEPRIERPWGAFRLNEADPLCVEGLRENLPVLEAWEREAQELHPAVVDPAEIIIAPDYLHKANISGGAPYVVELPSSCEDPVLAYEEHDLPFTDYLRLCFRWGGFSRLGDLLVPEEAAPFIELLRRDLEPF